MPETTTLRIDDYNALTQSVLTLRADLDDALTDRNRWRNDHMRLADEFAAYKRQVRALAIQAADDEGWCAEGLNNALRELGLEPRMFRYRVRTHILASQDIDIEVEAEDEDDAHDKVMSLSRSEIQDHVRESVWDALEVDDTSRIDQLGVA